MICAVPQLPRSLSIHAAASSLATLCLDPHRLELTVHAPPRSATPRAFLVPSHLDLCVDRKRKASGGGERGGKGETRGRRWWRKGRKPAVTVGVVVDPYVEGAAPAEEDVDAIENDDGVDVSITVAGGYVDDSVKILQLFGGQVAEAAALAAKRRPRIWRRRIGSHYRASPPQHSDSEASLSLASSRFSLSSSLSSSGHEHDDFPRHSLDSVDPNPRPRIRLIQAQGGGRPAGAQQGRQCDGQHRGGGGVGVLIRIGEEYKVEGTRRCGPTAMQQL
ncbi:hypothetical protein E2562_031656 [Oryza meyeriana var. granulata]|uniref:Uncharacterized protein n=1 Tax=Oryza meyeriana var. granulata TaxID=110450 RepID=A0A6G1E3X8_9ORYZ|nr:hypothetical protein E2562_031656 [Oryza meyeriana var. granulata]